MNREDKIRASLEKELCNQDKRRMKKTKLYLQKALDEINARAFHIPQHDAMTTNIAEMLNDATWRLTEAINAE